MRHKKDSSNKKGRHRKGGNKSRFGRGKVPELSMLVITHISHEGEVFAAPLEWDGKRAPPHIEVIESAALPAVSKGDRIMAKLRQLSQHQYQAVVIRVLPKETAKKIIGIFLSTQGGGGIIEPVSRKSKDSYFVAPEDSKEAINGELVSAVTTPDAPSIGLPRACIEERLGSLKSPRAASLIAAQLHSLPSQFSAAALAEAEASNPPVMEAGREDIRDIPLVTIDGEDARDFDDAVFAEPDTDDDNKGGFHLLVAIADVAYYVKEGSALDEAAVERGNSVYFPDRVIPMLPERLSNGLCSLNPNEDRYCIAVHLWIDAKGVTKRYRFIRGLMRSHARLTYNQVEHSAGTLDKTVQPLVANLIAAYKIMAGERDRRGALALNLPEFKVIFGENGEVAQIIQRPQLESNRLIESFMVAANVAAADYLIKHRAPGIYRVHEVPSEEKLEDLRQFLGLSGYSLPKGVITPEHLNRVLLKAESKPNKEIIHNSVLRSQMQAYYAHQNLGHFGLGLTHYCHFTSPIRRYSDLVVHRSLVALLEQDKAKLPPAGTLPDIALHISDTERRAMQAERDASDRYKVLFMTRHIGDSFSGRITGLNEYGLYITLPENGITGFVPVRNLGGDFFVYDKKHGCYKGHRSKFTYTLGDVLDVRVVEANPTTNNLIFQPEIPQAQAGIPIPGRSEPLRGKKKHGKPPKGKNHKRRGKK